MAFDPITGRLWAMATINPVPGWIMFMAPITGSVGPTTLLTARWTVSWVFGSIAVVTVRPPRLMALTRSSGVAPRLGVSASER